MIQNITVKSDQPLLWHGCRVGATCKRRTVARSISRPRASADLLQQQKTTRPAPAANKGNLQPVWCNDAEDRFREHISFLRANRASRRRCGLYASSLTILLPAGFSMFWWKHPTNYCHVITIPDGIVIIAVVVVVVVESAVIYKVLGMDFCLSN